MQPSAQLDYRTILTELIQKQIRVLGPDITLAKVKKVGSITIDAKGFVTDIQGDPVIALKKLIDEFVTLSSVILKQTMGSLVSTYPHLAQVVDNSHVSSEKSGSIDGAKASLEESINTDLQKLDTIIEDLDSEKI